MKEQIKIKIKNYINKNFYKGDIKDKINLFDTGIINSFAMLELVMFCEKEFNVDISNLDFYSEFNNINKISKYIYERKK